MIFTPADLRSRFRGLPFTPARIVTTTGQTYDVYHPDLVLIGAREITVGTPAPGDPESYDRVTRIALVHITELQDLPAAAPPASANGQHGGA